MPPRSFKTPEELEAFRAKERERAKAWRAANPEKADAHNEQQKRRKTAGDPDLNRQRLARTPMEHAVAGVPIVPVVPEKQMRVRVQRNAYMRLYRLANAEMSRLDNLRARGYYKGLSAPEVARELELANGRCSTCKEPADIVLDHRHDNGAYRGTICRKCNRILGVLDWLEQHPVEAEVLRLFQLRGK